MPWWVGFALVGWGFASWIIVLRSLPDPPPDAVTWLVTSLAGIIGGVVGAYLGAVSSPEFGALLVGALAGAAILLGVTRTFMRTRAKH
jgi:zinc transporter ZupT